MTIAVPLALPDPRDEVRKVVEGAGSSFAAGMRVLPRARREAIFAVYAFCRLVDDVADRPGRARCKLTRLAVWEDEVRRAYEGRARTAVGRELARAAGAHDLPQEEFLLVIEGMRMDAEGIVAPDPATLDRYVRCVAGAVGLLSMRVFGAWRGARSRAFALSLARAVQLTNILRDVEEDAGLGRLYLPRPILDAVGIPPDPRLAAAHPRLPEARAMLGAAARRHFGRARRLARAHALPAILPALLMMGPYERLLRDMEADWTRAPPPRPGWRKAGDGALCALRHVAGRGLG